MAGTQARGHVFRGAGRPIGIEAYTVDAPGHGEVLVRMVAAGVCHSDLHVVDGHWRRPAPLVLGHEGAAVVESIGEGVAGRVSGLEPGALVVLAWTAPCSSCTACARGEAWLCERPLGGGHRLDAPSVRLHDAGGQALGSYSGIGTWGTHGVVAAEAAIPVDRATPPEVAALIGCAVTTGVGAALNTARVQAGQRVAVVGLGGVGLSAVMGAAIAGAAAIVALDTRPAKLSLAESVGATAVLLAPAATPASVRDAAGGAVDHVLECAGSADGGALALELVRPGGTVTLVGMPAEGERLELEVYGFVDAGKRILGSNYGSGVPAEMFPRLARWHIEGRLPVDRLITERIGLDDVPAALAAMRNGEGARRVVVY